MNAYILILAVLERFVKILRDLTNVHVLMGQFLIPTLKQDVMKLSLVKKTPSVLETLYVTLRRDVCVQSRTLEMIADVSFYEHLVIIPFTFNHFQILVKPNCAVQMSNAL